MSASALEAFRRYLLEDEPWRLRAKCRGEQGETAEETKARLNLFFPHRGQTQKPAKALCARCPVQKECDASAIRSGTTYGIWGGIIRHRGPQPDKEHDGSDHPLGI